MEQAVTFRNSRGSKLVAILSNPSGQKDAPIFILCHGHGSSKNSQTFLSLKEKLGQAGISTLRFDFFGHGESEGSFEDFTATQAIADTTTAVTFLKTEGYSKIGLVGSSLGAFASILVGAKLPGIVAVALKSPTLDLTIWKSRMIDKFGKNWERVKSIEYKTSNIQASLSEARLDAIVRDATQYDIFETARNVKAPTLIVHGENDETVPVEISKKIAAAMPNCTLTIIKGADHEYTTNNTFDEMIDAIVQFLIQQK